MKSLFSVVAAGALLGIAATAQADVMGPAQSLSSVLATVDQAGQVTNDVAIQVGDKIFHNFQYQFDGDMPTANRVNVIPITDADGNYGIRFQGFFLDLAGGGASTATINYTVTVAPDAGMGISDAHIMGNPDVIGLGRITISESWEPTATDKKPIAIWEIKPAPEGVVPTQLIDFVSFLPDTYQELKVTKRIVADVGDLYVNDLKNRSVATMSFVDQTFSQVPVPEPATLGVLGLGAAALLLRRRRA